MAIAIVNVDGAKVSIEVEGPKGVRKAGLSDKISGEIDDAMKTVSDLARAFTKTLQGMSGEKPKRATVAFGLKLGIEAGWVVVKGTGEANFEVTLTWDPLP
jgi:hypothetical protein